MLARMGHRKAGSSGAPRPDDLSPELADLIERSRERAEQGSDRRERATELVVSAAFVAAAIALLLVLTKPVGPVLQTAGWLLAICVCLLRVEFDVGEGSTRPVQLVLVPMLVLLPPPLVPLLVAIAHLLAALPDIVARRMRPERATLTIANSWFAVGPALVVTATGVPDSWSLSAAAIVVAALAAEIVLDLTISAVRLRVGIGIDIRTQLGLFGWVYLVDVLLTPIGLLAAVASREDALAAGAVLPLAALLAVFARERRGRIENALELHRQASEEEARLQSIVQNSSDVIAILEADGRIRTLTGSVTPLFGSEWRAAIGTSVFERAHPDDGDLLRAFLADVAGSAPGESRELEWRMASAEAAWRHVETVATNLLDDPRLKGIVLTARDVNERKALEEQLRHRAFHDPLTQVANRALFYDRIEHVLAREARDDRLVSVLFLDLDDFKRLNDQHGHAAGDDVLIEVASRLRDAVRAGDTVARLGGDEFGVLVESVSSAAEAVQVAERILGAFREEFGSGGVRTPLAASVGIAISAPGDRGVDELLRKADLAMYAAKRNPGRRWELYDAVLDRVGAAAASEPGHTTWYQRADEQRQEVLDHLERERGIEPVYQPILDLRTGAVAGYEALARFADPLSRPPNVWFAQAHRHGLGYQLEAKALTAALVGRDRPPGTQLTLNVSPSALASDEVQAALPERLDGLVIEITENEVAFGDPALLAAIAAVRARGGRLAVDDAGSGYAGLKHVMRLAPDLIKLDGALVDGVHADPAKAALIESFVRYARKIGAAVCAEGIETIEDLRRLAELDVAYGQGYAIARPAAPWADASVEAVAACIDSYRENLDGDGARADERALDALTGQLANAADADALAGAIPDLMRHLSADAILVSLAGAADPIVAEVDRGVRGSSARLLLPLRCGGEDVGELELLRGADRPWSRDEVRHARILGHQLAGTVARVTAVPETA
jgi:diguanylate cyclase (GGDEF)-like protein/PAS domain S-box-containing protein